MRMQPKAAVVTIASDPASISAEWSKLRQQGPAIMAVDVVESVQLLQANVANVIDSWRRFVNEVRTPVLPKVCAPVRRHITSAAMKMRFFRIKGRRFGADLSV